MPGCNINIILQKVGSGNYIQYGDDLGSEQYTRWLTLREENEEEPDHQEECKCGHKIKWNYYIKNIISGEIEVIGSCCIKKFVPAELRGKLCELCGSQHRSRKDNFCKECRTKIQCTTCKKICNGMIGMRCLECSKQYCMFDVKCPNSSGVRCYACKQRCNFCDAVTYGTNGCAACIRQCNSCSTTIYGGKVCKKCYGCIFCGGVEISTKENLCDSCRLLKCECNNGNILCRLCEIKNTVLISGKYEGQTISECFKQKDYINWLYNHRNNDNYHYGYEIRLLITYCIYRLSIRNRK